MVEGCSPNQGNGAAECVSAVLLWYWPIRVSLRLGLLIKVVADILLPEVIPYIMLVWYLPIRHQASCHLSVGHQIMSRTTVWTFSFMFEINYLMSSLESINMTSSNIIKLIRCVHEKKVLKLAGGNCLFDQLGKRQLLGSWLDDQTL